MTEKQGRGLSQISLGQEEEHCAEPASSQSQRPADILGSPSWNHLVKQDRVYRSHKRAQPRLSRVYTFHSGPSGNPGHRLIFELFLHTTLRK
eukprot:COSAG01_NODE_6149_length_3823_cov_3.230666_3_plen_92_part_00